MPEINSEWVREQLALAKIKVGSAKTILKLLETWEQLPSLPPKVVSEVLDVLPKLILGQPLKVEESEEGFAWVDLQPGNIVVGDVVRVKSDAFTDKLGVTHNGRRGTVAAIRYGDVIFNDTDGKTPALRGTHYSPYKLEKRIRKN